MLKFLLDINYSLIINITVKLLELWHVKIKSIITYFIICVQKLTKVQQKQ